MGKIIYCFFITWYLLSANTTFAYTHADTLRGSNGRGRSWWDVNRYGLQAKFNMEAKSISGTGTINFLVASTPTDSMQIDLQEPLRITKVLLTIGSDSHDQTEVVISDFVKEGNVWWLKYKFSDLPKNQMHQLEISYDGTPREAVNAPWDGGFSWKADGNGKPWVSVSCQGLGASVWWPCKDAQWDEPENGIHIGLDVPTGLVAISNGRQTSGQKGRTVWDWEAKNPINNYDVTFYIGDYVNWSDTVIGEKGKLDIDFWVLRENEEKAHKHFAGVKQMIHCFEYWLGPYPFYEDGYKLVEAPYLGMEHQSAIAYGNNYKMGYRGFDRTMTGIGMSFDYIIVHESAHEWFGNNITSKDIADMWVHEGFTTFSECLYVECMQGKEKGQKYCRGEWLNIQNDKPIIGDYGVNNEGSNDMYDKGAAIIHMIRTMMNDDVKFRQLLRGLNKDFYHQTVTTQQVEAYVEKHTGLELSAFFNQYLRTDKIPEIEYAIKNGELSYKFNNVVDGFTLPLTVSAGNTSRHIAPTASWQHVKWDGGYNIKFSNDFLTTVK
jgi:aminopeptidase N